MILTPVLIDLSLETMSTQTFMKVNVHSMTAVTHSCSFPLAAITPVKNSSGLTPDMSPDHSCQCQLSIIQSYWWLVHKHINYVYKECKTTHLQQMLWLLLTLFQCTDPNAVSFWPSLKCKTNCNQYSKELEACCDSDSWLVLNYISLAFLVWLVFRWLF